MSSDFLVESRRTDMYGYKTRDLKVSEVRTETEIDNFWSKPRLTLRLTQGFIPKFGAAYFQIEMKIWLIAWSLKLSFAQTQCLILVFNS